MGKYIKAPLEKEIAKTLRAGDYVYHRNNIQHVMQRIKNG